MGVPKLRQVLRELGKYYKNYKLKNKQQDKLFLKLNNIKAKSLILFIVPPEDYVNGGILSIASIYNESKKLKDIHTSEVMMTVLPLTQTFLKYTQFENNFYVFRFDQVVQYYKNLDNLIIHVPECLGKNFFKSLSLSDKKWLKKIKKTHINILNQNIQAMPTVKIIDKLKLIFDNVTCTTAHQQYSTLEERKRLGIPLHKLSTYVDYRQYYFNSYDQKENIMIISPDDHPMKDLILEKIKKEIPDLKLNIIQNMKYEDYKSLISKAKWAITFGEGLDGYFLEPIWSGAISFAVYNTIFFTSDFTELETVYDNYEELIKNICKKIRILDKEENYTLIQKKQFDLINKYYKYDEYVNNIKDFYLNNYTFP